MYWNDPNNTLLDTVLRCKRLGLVSDFDGTLSPIVPNRDDAHPLPEIPAILTSLGERLPLVALVSGRSAADVAARAGVAGAVYIGNHGMERLQDGHAQAIPAIQAYRPTLEIFKNNVTLGTGMELEDKGATLAIHYRNADPATASGYAPLLQELATQHGLRFFAGRKVYEIRPPVEIDKGTALAELVRDYGLDGVLFLGDDTTDAAAMRTAQELRNTGACLGVALGVESAEMPAPVRENADFMARDVADVLAFLRYVLSRIAS